MKSIVKTNKNIDLANKIVNLILFLYFIFYLLEKASGFSTMVPRWALGMMGYFLILNICKENTNKINISINKINIKRLSIIYLLLLFSFLSMVYTRNISLGGYVYSIHFYGVVLLLTNFKLDVKLVKFSFYLHVAFFVFHMISGSNSNEIFNVSRNYISIIMLTQIILLYVTLYQSNYKISIIPAIINSIICIWAVGRSGIIVSLIIIIGVLLHKSKVCIKIEKTIKISVVIITMTVLILMLLPSILTFVSGLEGLIKFYIEKGLESSGRSKIIQEYFRLFSFNVGRLLFGVNTNGNMVFDLWERNLHNSYLRAHSIYGIIGLGIILFSISRAALHLIKEKNILLLMLLLAVCARIFTDTAAFFGILDPIIYYFVLNDNVFHTKQTEEIELQDIKKE